MAGPVIRSLLRRLAPTSPRGLTVPSADLALGQLGCVGPGDRSPSLGGLDFSSSSVSSSRGSCGQLYHNDNDDEIIYGYNYPSSHSRSLEGTRASVSNEVDDPFLLPPPTIELDESLMDLLLPGLRRGAEIVASSNGVSASDLDRNSLTSRHSNDSTWRRDRALQESILKVWALTVAAERMNSGQEAAAAAKKILALRLVAVPPRRRAFTQQGANQSASRLASRAGTVRMPVGCCQVVRVGRRRVAVQRVPRQSAIGGAGRRQSPRIGLGVCLRQ